MASLGSLWDNSYTLGQILDSFDTLVRGYPLDIAVQHPHIFLAETKFLILIIYIYH